MVIMQSPRLKGRKLIRARLELLKKKTEEGYFLVADTSELIITRGPNHGEYAHSFEHMNVDYGHEIAWYYNLSKGILSREINLYLTERTRRELHRTVEYARENPKSMDSRLSRLGDVVANFIHALKEQRRIFNPIAIDSLFYQEFLQYQDILLLDFLKETLLNHYLVNNGKIPQADAEFLIGALYTSQSPVGGKMLTLFDDDHITYLEKYFIKSYEQNARSFLIKNLHRLRRHPIEHTRIRKLLHQENQEGELSPLTKLVLPQKFIGA